MKATIGGVNVVIQVVMKTSGSKMSPLLTSMSTISIFQRWGYPSPQSRPATSNARGMVKTRSVKPRNELKSRGIHHGTAMAPDSGECSLGMGKRIPG